jgi:hypothetical protein
MPVDQAAGILDDDKALDLHLASGDVDRDDRDMAGVGEGAVRVIVATADSPVSEIAGNRLLW